MFFFNLALYYVAILKFEIYAVVRQSELFTGADRESDGWGGAPLAVTCLANLGKTWLFLYFLNLIVKIKGDFIQA